ncbi:MAG TPA: HAD family phosphatase [Acidimicrobiia bacterium]|nr:HAD family phosphatase [Acidimicrobiia bacterium]
MNLYGFEADAVLFDCDGVLVDSEPVSFVAWSLTLRQYGYELGEREFAESVGGTETMVAVRYSPLVGVGPERLEDEARAHFERMAHRASGFADALQRVEALEEAAVPVAVATNGLRWRLDVLLTAVDLARLLPVSVTADEVPSPKPAPDLYLAAAARVGTPPARCLVLEDSPTGIAAAKAAGCRVVAVDRGMFDRGRLAAADAIVPRV